MVSAVMGLFTAGGSGMLATGSAALGGMQGLMTAGSVLSSIAGGFSAMSEGKAAKEWAGIDARAEQLKSRNEAVGIRKDMLRNIANQRVAFAGSGVDISYGTPEGIYQNTLDDGQYNIDMALDNGDIGAARSTYRGNQAAKRANNKALSYGLKGLNTAGNFMTDISKRG